MGIERNYTQMIEWAIVIIKQGKKMISIYLEYYYEAISKYFTVCHNVRGTLIVP